MIAIAIYALAALFVFWNVAPIVAALALPGVPWKHRAKAAANFVHVPLRGLLVLPVSITAPVVVPVALLFTKWSDDRLPLIFRWWDNDVSINGDAGLTWSVDPVTGVGRPDRVPEDDTADVRAICYWAKGHHPRSFYARFVWLGLRNRGSFLAAQLGAPTNLLITPQSWGDRKAGRSREGWALMEHNGRYQLIASKRIGAFCCRANYGFKVNHWQLGRARVPVSNVTFSLLRWKGEAQQAGQTANA